MKEKFVLGAWTIIIMKTLEICQSVHHRSGQVTRTIWNWILRRTWGLCLLNDLTTTHKKQWRTTATEMDIVGPHSSARTCPISAPRPCDVSAPSVKFPQQRSTCCRKKDWAVSTNWMKDNECGKQLNRWRECTHSKAFVRWTSEATDIFLLM